MNFGSILKAGHHPDENDKNWNNHYEIAPPQQKLKQ